MDKAQAITQWQQIQSVLYRDRVLYGYVFATTLCLYVLSLRYLDDPRFEFDPIIYLATLVQVCYVTFLVWCCVYYVYLFYHRKPHPTLYFFRAIRSFFQPLSKAISFALLVLALNLTFSSYTFLKPLIPELNPFQFDELFYQLDKWLHFGVSPWQITHQVFSNALASSVINFLYHLWFLLMWGSVLLFIIRRDLEKLRDQFLITFLTSWLLIGGVAAVLMSSAGPCYMHLLNPEHQYYLPLIERLETQSQTLVDNHWFPLWALDVQEMLWQMYSNQNSGIGGGISAMPSMHVSVAVTMALAFQKLHKKLGYLMWGYVLAIQIGSVHLAWHYAIDGYLSAILTLVIWKSVGALHTLKSSHLY